MPYERTRAVVETRKLLQTLSSAEEVTIRGLVQTVALGLLRHYPLDIDLDISASALPGIWAAPKHPRSGSTSGSECPGGTPGPGDADDIRSQGESGDQTACGS
ncbi:BPSL0761 family protein [Paraburkholderia caribensis]|uniref:BPSL0761 family protein n=1 Tax=Paraburkholderia caribensis TaxID=75105 RepID=UPI00286CACD2|nr:BPSL0761 family protein [Paraburkholderia caribensis]